jgi:hypothetical protein
MLENATRLDHVAHDPETKPNTIERIANDDAWAPVKAVPAFQRIVADVDVKKVWDQKDKNGRRDAGGALALKQVRALIADPEFRRVFAEVDVESVIRRALAPPQPDKK